MPSQDEFRLRRLLLQKQMANALSQGSYIQPGEPPAKAWQPAIQILGGLVEGKRLAGEEKTAKKNYQAILANALSPVITPAETLPEGQMGPSRPESSRPKTREEVAQELLRNPDTVDIGMKLWLQRFAQPQNPASVQETEWYMKQPQDVQGTHERLKRAQQMLNLGGQQVVLDPRGGIRESYAVTPKPAELPEFKGQQATAVELGKKSAEQITELGEMKANLPRLEVVVGQLSDLGKKATYTRSGQAVDVVRRELNLKPREASVARKEYISKVDNEVLPLLRQTFGAQFTQKEGESLKATLGDPNASPEEKEAVLRSFIDSKRSQIETQRKRLQQTDLPQSNGSGRIRFDANGNRIP